MLKFSLLAFMLTIVEVLLDKDGFKAFEQDYNVSINRYEVEFWSKKHFQYMNAATFKHNRSIAAFNLTVVPRVEIANDLQYIVQAYKFLSNEYRIYPLRFQISLCDSMKLNAAGAGNLYKCGNINNCTLHKGVRYEICNFAADTSKLPPLIPSGQYRMTLQTFVRDEYVARFDCYADIFREVKIPQ